MDRNTDSRLPCGSTLHVDGSLGKAKRARSESAGVAGDHHGARIAIDRIDLVTEGSGGIGVHYDTRIGGDREISGSQRQAEHM